MNIQSISNQLGKQKKLQEIIFPIFDVSLNGVNYFFHIFVSWYLIPDDYGKLNSLLSLISILTVIGVSFQTYTAKYISSNKDSKSNLKGIFKSSTVCFFIFTAFILLFSPVLIRTTKSDFISIVIIILILGSNIFLSVIRGIFQGTKNFFILNISFYIEVLFKILALFLLLRNKSNIYSVLLAILFGMIFSLIHGVYKARRFLNLKQEVSEIKGIAVQVTNIYIANFFFNFFTSIDMIMVNYYLPRSSGIFAVVLKYNQLLTFASSSIFTVFIPLLTEKLYDRKKFNKCIKNLFLIMVGVSIFTLIFYKFVMPYTVTIFFGKQYAHAKDYFFIGIISYIFLSFIFIIINIYIIIEKWIHFIVLFIASIAFMIIIALHHENITSIFYIEIIFYAVLFFILLMSVIHVLKPKKVEGGKE
ncbi:MULTISPECIES: oligosaccharide flippase family protein [Clostridium]|uniref:oligosaccharide flippase family protein n=1 Tax=Clostridium TaxID=1485 RepID=UPI00082534F7|nr:MULTISPECIES: oligosaccharide flippase family protein [Clostridium]PJI09640.1 transporter [Clostridium sp. CT7]